MFEELKRKRRDGLRFKTIVASALFGAIILVFVFLDMNPSAGGVGQGGAAAVVNGDMISQAQVAEAAENLRRNPFYAQFGGQDSSFLQVQALQSLINGELLSQEAQKQGLLVSNDQIRDMIVNEQFFQEDGRFKRDRYMGYLSAVRKTAGEFETQQRKDLMRQRATRILSAGLQPTELEVQRELAVKNLKANAEFVAIPTNEAVKPEAISAADVDTYVKGDGKKPIEEYYSSHKEEFSTSEEVNARHILVKAAKGDKAAEEKARTKVQEIKKRLEKEDFAKVAADLSEDDGSKAKGGELGFFGKGRMVPEFETAAFTLEPKTISEPVQTDFGFHIIQVLEKRAAQTSSLEQAQEKIARKLLAEQRSSKAIDEVREIVKKGDVGAINQWVQSQNLKWEETGTFSVDAESVPKVGSNSEFADAAFKLSPAKPVLDRLIRQGESTYIVRYKAPVIDASKPTETKPEILKETLATQRSQDAFSRWVKNLRDSGKVSISDGFGTGQTE